MSGCLGRLPRAERRVLVLRAGVGIVGTRSRRQVARITGLRPARVTTLERRGLRRLRALGRGGGCAAASEADPVALAGAPSGTASSGGPAPAEPAATGRVLGEHHSGGPVHRKAPGEASTAVPSIGALGAPPGGGSSFDLGYPLLAVALALFSVMIVREVRRTI